MADLFQVADRSYPGVAAKSIAAALGDVAGVAVSIERCTFRDRSLPDAESPQCRQPPYASRRYCTCVRALSASSMTDELNDKPGREHDQLFVYGEFVP